MPTTELLPPPVTSRPRAQGEPAADAFQEWLSQQPEDPELSRLASVVQEAERDCSAVRESIPKLLADRRSAEDSGAGIQYADAVAKLAGLPRLTGKLATRRAQSNLQWLARLAVLAEAAAIAAEASHAYERAEAGSLRRDLHTRHESGRLPHEGAMTDGEAGVTASLVRSFTDRLAPSVAAAERSREVVVSAKMRGRFLDPKGDASRLDIMLPTTWETALTLAAELAKTDTEREIKHGK